MNLTSAPRFFCAHCTPSQADWLRGWGGGGGGGGGGGRRRLWGGLEGRTQGGPGGEDRGSKTRFRHRGRPSQGGGGWVGQRSIPPASQSGLSEFWADRRCAAR